MCVQTLVKQIYIYIYIYNRISPRNTVSRGMTACRRQMQIYIGCAGVQRMRQVSCRVSGVVPCCAGVQRMRQVSCRVLFLVALECRGCDKKVAVCPLLFLVGLECRGCDKKVSVCRVLFACSLLCLERQSPHPCFRPVLSCPPLPWLRVLLQPGVVPHRLDRASKKLRPRRPTSFRRHGQAIISRGVDLPTSAGRHCTGCER